VALVKPTVAVEAAAAVGAAAVVEAVLAVALEPASQGMVPTMLWVWVHVGKQIQIRNLLLL